VRVFAFCFLTLPLSFLLEPLAASGGLAYDGRVIRDGAWLGASFFVEMRSFALPALSLGRLSPPCGLLPLILLLLGVPPFL
jgi:hypothetical protein